MPLDITLESFDGVVIKKSPYWVTPDLFEGLPESEFKLLKYIDPYDDTIFNSLMCKDLLSDLETLKFYKPENIKQIDEILKLVSECEYGSHSYVKFLGD